MANKEEEFPLGTPQEHALICEKHDLRPIDVTCEDCEEFICSKCAKEDHKDHDWDTISTAATIRTRGLLKAMTKIEEKDIQQIDEHIQKASQQMEENKKRYESQVLKLQKHYDAMVEMLDKIKKKREKILRDSLERKNADMSKAKSSLEEKKKKVLQGVKSIKEEGSTMTDIILIKTHRELTKLISTEVDYKQKFDFLLRHEGGDINEAMLESMMGQTFDAEQITVTETDSFQGGEEAIFVLEATNESSCLLSNAKFENVVQFSKSGMKEKQFTVSVFGVCVTDNNEVYVSDVKNMSISCLSPSGSVSPVFSTAPLTPWGICQTMDDGLLITLWDTESDPYQPNSDSRRLVRHVTLTGDVIREYEYQEDGQTRLFTLPRRVTQNGNTDICVINAPRNTTSELLILSFSGSLKSVYPKQEHRHNFSLTDVVCDSYHNIIVSEEKKRSVHLLSSDGEFMRYLLTENQINNPSSMSLKKSTLWISDYKGRVKVFQYNRIPKSS
uniref:Uncharacterized protein LOC111132500 n=1 Tax=Crassostrea virginica TaxID=6565 RepID=A0A8B8E8M2_CRAVI|nr:uncharacterized protein LOC111132500 [Crassostrea virginica]